METQQPDFIQNTLNKIEIHLCVSCVSGWPLDKTAQRSAVAKKKKKVEMLIKISYVIQLKYTSSKKKQKQSESHCGAKLISEICKSKDLHGLLFIISPH